MSWDEFSDFFRPEARFLVVNSTTCKFTDVIRKAYLLPKVCLVDEFTVRIHLTGKNAFALVISKTRESPMESADASEKVYELNFLHVGSLAT